MKERKNIKWLIAIFIIILAITIFPLLMLLNKEEEKLQVRTATGNRQDLENDIYDESRQFSDIEELLDSYGCKLIKKESASNYVLYLTFGKNLSKQNGEPNKKYFESLINACAKKLAKKKFYLYDESKSIKIAVTCDFSNSSIKYIINDIPDYFNNLDNDMLMELEKMKIVDKQSISVPYNILYKIINFNMKVIEDMGEAEGKEGKYTIYQKGAIKSRNFSGKVRNIIFTKEYKGEVLSGISVGTPLEDIAAKYPKIAFGSVKDGYLGYRTDDVYVFIYKDEISVYGYSYHEQSKFDQLLSDYFSTKNLKKFRDDLMFLWQNYDEYEYNSIDENLYLTYPSMGVIIDIKGNDPKGICFYSNYFLTEKTRRFALEGRVSVDSSKDLLLLSETSRRQSGN